MRIHHPGKTPDTGQPRRTADRTTTPAPRLAASVYSYAVDSLLDSPAQPLATPLTEEMAARLGGDFCRVPVHTDGAARAGATEAGARAVVHPLEGTAGRFPERAPVQRLMNPATFTASTDLTTDKIPLSRGRDKVTAVDDALEAYHKVTYLQAAEKLTALDNLITACGGYLALPDKEAKRKPGVRALRAEANAERSLVEGFGRALGADGLAKARALVEVEDQVVAAKLGGEKSTLHGLSIELGQAIWAAVHALSDEDKRTFMMDDINTLDKMSTNEALPQVTRDVLREVVANVELLHLGPGKAGSGFTSKDDPKYFVSNEPTKALGSGERLGSLAHELTHVSTSESYRNTVLMWAFTKDLSDTEIKARSTERLGQLNALIRLINAIPDLHQTQKDQVRKQLDYAKDPNLLADPNKLTEEEQKRYKDLAGEGVNWSSLIEFDTCVNQCLVYMASWGVPNDEPFHAHLQEVARQAYDERKAALTG